jgi:thiamine biosynthesis lipoprotein ApbE
VVLYAPSEATAQKAMTAALARVAQLVRLSDYDPESELSRLSAGSPSRCR